MGLPIAGLEVLSFDIGKKGFSIDEFDDESYEDHLDRSGMLCCFIFFARVWKYLANSLTPRGIFFSGKHSFEDRVMK